MPYEPTRFWAHLEKVREYWEPLVAPGKDGQPAIVDSHHRKLLELRCACGRVFSIPKVDFPGRRKLKACGGPECPYTRGPATKRQPEQLGISKTIYISEDNLRWLQAKKRKHGISVSKIVDTMVSKARADELVESS